MKIMKLQIWQKKYEKCKKNLILTPIIFYIKLYMLKTSQNMVAQSLVVNLSQKALQKSEWFLFYRRSPTPAEN